MVNKDYQSAQNQPITGIRVVKEKRFKKFKDSIE